MKEVETIRTFLAGRLCPRNRRPYQTLGVQYGPLASFTGQAEVSDSGDAWAASHSMESRISCSSAQQKRCSEREPAVWLRDKSNVIGGWLPSLTFALGHRMRSPPPLPYRPRWIGWLALLLAVALNCALATSCVQFFDVPKGAFIRPMAWAFWNLLLWACGFAGIVGIAVVAAAVQRTFVLSSLAITLAVLAFFVPGWLLNLAARLNGFVVAERYRMANKNGAGNGVNACGFVDASGSAVPDLGR